MSTPKHTRNRNAKTRPWWLQAGYASESAGRAALKASVDDSASYCAAEPWFPRADVPGYMVTLDGRLAREVKVRKNKNGTRFARVSVKGKQRTIKV
jgi:hypothetical protein